MATVLTVDDDESILGIYRNMLNIRGHRIVAEARDGKAAVDIFSGMTQRPDIIIMDHRMPVRNGIDTMKAIHSINPLQGIIFVTADYGAAKQALKEGASSFVLKPFRMDDLFNSIETALAAQRERQNELRESLLRFITMLNSRDPKDLASICDRIDREIIEGVLAGPGLSDSMSVCNLGEALCSFFNIMDMDYTYVLEGSRLTIRNKRCHWNETLGPNPLFCFVSKCIISKFAERTGRRYSLETEKLIMNHDDECLFNLIFD